MAGYLTFDGSQMQVAVARLRFTTQAVDIAHVLPGRSPLDLTEGPLLVSPMNDGNLFVHDGRHRLLRALLAGQEFIDAEWLD